jgi:DNA-binding response OmpR family regulator
MVLPSKHRLFLIDTDEQYLSRLSWALEPEFELCILHRACEVFDQIPRYTPDLIILETDLSGLDGIKLVHALQRDPALRETPCIFLSWRDTEADVRLGYMVHAALYLSKRLSLGRIVQTLHSYIHEHNLPVRSKLRTTQAVHEEQGRVARGEAPSAPLRTAGGAPGPVEKPAAAEPTASAPTGRVRILVAEPDHAAIFAIEAALKGHYGCIRVTAGLEVLEKTRRYLPDILILNMHMPQMPGFEVSKILRTDPLFLSAPILGTTRAEDPLRFEYVRRYGVTHVFQLPAELERLACQVHTVTHDPDFRQHAYPQPFEQLFAEEEADRKRHEDKEILVERMRRDKEFQDLIREGREKKREMKKMP